MGIISIISLDVILQKSYELGSITEILQESRVAQRNPHIQDSTVIHISHRRFWYPIFAEWLISELRLIPGSIDNKQCYDEYSFYSRFQSSGSFEDHTYLERVILQWIEVILTKYFNDITRECSKTDVFCLQSLYKFNIILGESLEWISTPCRSLMFFDTFPFRYS